MQKKPAIKSGNSGFYKGLWVLYNSHQNVKALIIPRYMLLLRTVFRRKMHSFPLVSMLTRAGYGFHGCKPKRGIEIQNSRY